jgi:psp operon transcriptional activator
MEDSRRPLDEVVLDPFGAAAGPAAVVPVAVPEASPGEGFRARVEGFERGVLEAALVQAKFNQKQAAVALGLGYHQLRNAMKRLGVTIKTPR